MLYDISPTVSAATPVWPGDTPFRAERTWSIDAGDPVNVTSITTTPHLGAHADAPLHVTAGGAGIAELPLEPFLGPCRLVDVPPETLILPNHLEGVDLADPPRLLLRTGSVRWGAADGAADAAGRAHRPEGADGGDRVPGELPPPPFPERFSALSPELARLLAEAGTLLVGLDSPSVDPFDSKDLPAHHALVQGGVVNLEGLALDGVPAGVYELVALPLKLAGLDASPVRAVLRAG